MANHRITSLATTSRLLVAGAMLLFVLLAVAAALTNSAGMDMRLTLGSDSNPSQMRMTKAMEIEQLLGRGGFSGQLMSFAADLDPATLTTMDELLDQASLRADEFAELGEGAAAQQYLQTAQGRIASGRISLASLTSGVRAPDVVALNFAGDLAAFDTAFDQFRIEEQRSQTIGALGVLNLQRWITSLALAVAVFVMGAGALMLHMNVRRPMRKLTENLEDLLTDEEGRSLRETDRPDEIGDLARVAEQLRQTQLQAGRLLTFGSDGTFRLRLEGENARSVNEALDDLTTAADTARSSALSMAASGDTLAKDGREALEKIQIALGETVEETSNKLDYLSKAGEEVLKFAGNLKEARAVMDKTGTEWREGLSTWQKDISGLSTGLRDDMSAIAQAAHGDMSSLTSAMRDDMMALATTTHGDMTSLTGTMRDELDTLHQSAQRLGEMTESVSDRVELTSAKVNKAGDDLIDITKSWEREQIALGEASENARENLSARIVALDAKIGNLDDTLFNLDELATRAATPIEEAAHILGNAVQGISLAGDGAAASVEVLTQEIAATRAAREILIEEIEADRAGWETTRMELNQQAATTIDHMGVATVEIHKQANDAFGQIGESANRMESLAKELTDGAADVPSRMDQLSNDLSGLSGQIHLLEQSGGALATQLGGRMSSMHDMLDETRISMNDTRVAMTEEADTIRGVTSDLSELHVRFDEERGLVGKQVASVSETIGSLDEHLKQINERIETPVDLNPVLDALKDEMGQAVTSINEMVELQAIKTEIAVVAGVETLGKTLLDTDKTHADELDAHFEGLSTNLEKILSDNGEKQRELITNKIKSTYAAQKKSIATDLRSSAAKQQKLIAAVLEDNSLAQRAQMAADLETNTIKQNEIIAADMNERAGAQNQMVATSIAALMDRFDTAIQDSGKIQSQDRREELEGLSEALQQAITRNLEKQEGAMNSGLVDLSNSIHASLDETSEDQLQLVATGLSELSTTLNGKMATQGDVAKDLSVTLRLLDDRIGDLSKGQDATQKVIKDNAVRPDEFTADLAALIEPRLNVLEASAQEAIEQNAAHAAQALSADDVMALIDPRIENLNIATTDLGEDLRGLIGEIAGRKDEISPQVLEHIARVEEKQGGMSEAQQSIALALHDGLQGLSRRLRTSDINAAATKLSGVTATISQQQDQLTESMQGLSSDMTARLDDLAGEIARGNRQARQPQMQVRSPQARQSEIAIKSKKPSAKMSVASGHGTPVVKASDDSELSSIYDALRGLTQELKGISDDGETSPVAPTRAPKLDRQVI